MANKKQPQKNPKKRTIIMILVACGVGLVLFAYGRYVLNQTKVNQTTKPPNSKMSVYLDFYKAEELFKENKGIEALPLYKKYLKNFPQGGNADYVRRKIEIIKEAEKKKEAKK